MAKINVPKGEGMEAKRIWSLAPELGKAMGGDGRSRLHQDEHQRS